MQISDILTEGMIIAEAAGSNKEGVLRLLAERLCQHPDVPISAEIIHEGLMNRERLGSTGVGGGVAIPHAKIGGLSHLVAGFARVSAGVPFDAIDKQPAKLIFVLLVPENSAGAHLKALARISRLLKDESFRQALLEKSNSHSLYEAFTIEDAKH